MRAAIFATSGHAHTIAKKLLKAVAVEKAAVAKGKAAAVKANPAVAEKEKIIRIPVSQQRK